jgi:hypothetical protein
LTQGDFQTPPSSQVFPWQSLIHQSWCVTRWKNMKLAIIPTSMLLLPFIDGLVINNILPHLPMTLSMLWHFHQVSKMWFRVVGENGAWNKMENIRADHRSYLHTLKETNNARQSFQAHLEFEVHCLETCLLASDVNIITYDIDIKSYEDFSLNLEIPR